MRRMPQPRLGLVVAVVGSASLGTEIAAARLLAPYFGASTIIWANTIATVLVALSVGYWLGGRMADRDPSPDGLHRLVLVAAVLLAIVPFLAGPFLGVAVDALDSVQAGAFIGSLVAVLVLVATPVLVLGMVSPYAIRLSMQAVDEAGRVAGRLYAISTIGSLAGTFLSALLLIPLVGTRRTFLTFALALAVVGVLGLARARYVLVPAALAAALALPVGIVKAETTDGRVIDDADTEYQYARVIQAPDGARRLELNEGQATHSLRLPGTYLTDDYWDDLLVLPVAARGGVPPRRVAILGNAGGTTARAFGHFYPQTYVDGVEIDPEVTALGRRWFDLRGPHLRTITADARPFLRATRERYDAILVDAYRQPYIPFYLTTREFFALVHDRLTPGGVMVINIGHPERSDALEKVLSATIAQDFDNVVRVPSERTNTLVVASDAPLSAARMRAALPRVPRALRPRVASDIGLLAPRLQGGRVFTDDRAPVEWLIDASIVQVAAEGER
jgi:spermidine synthase